MYHSVILLLSFVTFNNIITFKTSPGQKLREIVCFTHEDAYTEKVPLTSEYKVESSSELTPLVAALTASFAPRVSRAQQSLPSANDCAIALLTRESSLARSSPLLSITLNPRPVLCPRFHTYDTLRVPRVLAAS